jgi:dipeptidase D
MPINTIENLEPKMLWERFYGISQIPRPSKKEDKIRRYIKLLLNELKISFNEDSTGNIAIQVPATEGYEKSPSIILQGHVDMVCEKNKNKAHDFDNDPIELIQEDGWIKANGTTLGSDNGIGVAAALAIITDKHAVHGPLEILLTVDEETGMTGASNIETDFIKGKILLNVDSEEDGVFYIGCAGGIDTNAEFNLEKVTVPGGFASYELYVTGLKGGHSGMDINTGKANAIKLLARTLKNMSINGIHYYLDSISGGKLRNAIPREAEAILFIKSEDENVTRDFIADFYSKVFTEVRKSDNGLKIEFSKCSKSPNNLAIEQIISDNIINTLIALPHGVISMSQDIDYLVETSTNLAVISTLENKVVIGTSQRSSLESSKNYIAQNVRAVFELAGANVYTYDRYPGWKPNLNSKILKISKKVYHDLFNQEPEVKAVHAGLETGILGAKNPELDMVSFGPTIRGAHSPEERVNIKSVQKFYELLKGILKEIAVTSIK